MFRKHVAFSQQEERADSSSLITVSKVARGHKEVQPVLTSDSGVGGDLIRS